MTNPEAARQEIEARREWFAERVARLCARYPKLTTEKAAEMLTDAGA
jgi:hypothetical protein